VIAIPTAVVTSKLTYPGLSYIIIPPLMEDSTHRHFHHMTKCPNDRSAGMSQTVLRLATGSTARVRFPLEARDFSSYHSVRTESGAHPAGRGVMLTTHLQLVPRSRMVDQSIYIETSVRNKCRCSFYCALITLHKCTT
jgi:hypothetical protein